MVPESRDGGSERGVINNSALNEVIRDHFKRSAEFKLLTVLSMSIERVATFRSEKRDTRG